MSLPFACLNKSNGAKEPAMSNIVRSQAQLTGMELFARGTAAKNSIRRQENHPILSHSEDNLSSLPNRLNVDVSMKSARCFFEFRTFDCVGTEVAGAREIFWSGRRKEPGTF